MLFSDLSLCNSAPDLKGANKELQPKYGRVTYTCFQGLNFADGLQTKHLYCPCDGDWAGAVAVVGHCYSKHCPPSTIFFFDMKQI